MKSPLIFVVAGVVFLTGCSSVQDRQAKANTLIGNIGQVAGDTVNTVKKTAADTQAVAKQSVKTAEDLKKRADKIANGVQQVQEGLSGK